MKIRKRYLALALFLFVGLASFTFANPTENAKTAEKKEKNSYTEALETVEKLEKEPTIENVKTAREEILAAEDANVEQVNVLQTRVDVAEDSIDVANLVSELEKLVEKKESYEEAKEKYPRVESKVNNLTDGNVKENLKVRINKVSKILNDTTAPKIGGVDETKPTNKNEIVYISDELLDKVTIGTTEYTEADFTKEGDIIKFQKKITHEGTYKVVATDKSGNSTTKTFVIDKTKPAVKSNWWKKTIEVDKNTEFVDFPEFTITDDTEVTTEFVKGEVKMGVPGVYRLRYRFTDAAGNSIDKEVQVTVVDTTPATITLPEAGRAGKNKNEYIVEAGTEVSIEDIMATVTDNVDETSKLVPYKADLLIGTKEENIYNYDFSNGFKTNYVGRYNLYYEYKDKAGNVSTAGMMIVMKDTIPATITLPEAGRTGKNKNEYIVEAGTEVSIEDIMATVTDNVDETSKLVPYKADLLIGTKEENIYNYDFSNGFKTNYVGRYNLYYEYKDKAGNISTAGMMIVMKDTTVPEVKVDIRKDKGITDIVASDATNLSFKIYRDNKVVHSFNSGINYKRFSIDWLGDGKYTVEVTDKGRNTKAVEATIDHTKPEKISTSYSPKEEITEGPVTVTIRVNEQILPIEGWTLSEDKKAISKSFDKNINGNVVISDLAGNTDKIYYLIENIADKMTIEDITNASEQIIISKDKKVILNLEGKNIDVNFITKARHIKNEGTLIIRNGKITNNNTGYTYGLVDNYGTITLENVEIEDNGSGRGSTIRNRTDATMTLKNVTVKDTGTSKDGNIPLFIDGGTITIENSKFETVATERYPVIINGGNVTINGNETKVKGIHGGLGVNAGKVKINGGTFDGDNYYGIWITNNDNKTEVIINDGTFIGGLNGLRGQVDDGKQDKGDVGITINGGNFSSKNASKAAMYVNKDGSIREWTTAIHAGTFSTDVSTYLAETSTQTAKDGKFIVTKN
ncbi:MAG: right-handed parallel beta-helix repeat-containing protein [Bacilli bacterium]|nr:right-handed parallel beta-helix repeat-containing protein [Bacilli bacterium]